MKIAVISNNDVHVFIRRNVFEIKSIIEIDVYRQSKPNTKIFNDFQKKIQHMFDYGGTCH